MNFKFNKNDNFWVIFFTVIISFFIMPAVVYFSGWCYGFFAKILIGNILIQAANNIFKVSITTEMLPTIGGILATIGYFFRTSGLSIDRD